MQTQVEDGKKQMMWTQSMQIGQASKRQPEENRVSRHDKKAIVWGKRINDRC